MNKQIVTGLFGVGLRKIKYLNWDLKDIRLLGGELLGWKNELIKVTKTGMEMVQIDQNKFTWT